jgi:2-polyprenyl-3-methyl-5-hydroxy-6-metoxy-1,4-benzoquinol methylase
MRPRHRRREQVSPDLYDRTYFLEHCGGYQVYARSRGHTLDARLAVVFQMAKIQTGMRVLDLGCGRGELVLHGARCGARVWGLDQSLEAIEISQQTLCGAPRGVRQRAALARGTALRLPLPDQAFHRVLLSDILEHLLPEELARTLSEIHRVARGDGWVVFHTFPNRWFYTLYHPLKRLLRGLARHQAGPRDPRTPYERAMHVNELSPLGVLRAFGPYFRVRLWCAHRDRWESSSGTFRRCRGPLDWLAQPEIWGIAAKRR